MKIEYEVTVDEMIETQLLWLRGTNVFKKWIAWGVFYWLLVVALITYFAEGDTIVKLAVGFIFGAFLGGPIILNHKSLIGKRIRKLLLKKLGNEQLGLARVCINNERVEYASNDTVISYNLSALVKVEEIDKGLLLDFSKGQIIYLPKAAFDTEEVLSQWKSKLNEYCSIT